MAKRDSSVDSDDPTGGLIIRFGLLKLVRAHEVPGLKPRDWLEHIPPEERAAYLLDRFQGLCAEAHIQDFGSGFTSAVVRETDKLLREGVGTDNSRKAADLLATLYNGTYWTAQQKKGKLNPDDYARQFDDLNRQAVQLSEQLDVDVNRFLYLLWLRADRGDKWQDWWQLDVEP
jgi:hypothetical protein